MTIRHLLYISRRNCRRLPQVSVRPSMPRQGGPSSAHIGLGSAFVCLCIWHALRQQAVLAPHVHGDAAQMRGTYPVPNATSAVSIWGQTHQAISSAQWAASSAIPPPPPPPTPPPPPPPPLAPVGDSHAALGQGEASAQVPAQPMTTTIGMAASRAVSPSTLAAPPSELVYMRREATPDARAFDVPASAAAAAVQPAQPAQPVPPTPPVQPPANSVRRAPRVVEASRLKV